MQSTVPYDHTVRVISIFATSWRYPKYEQEELPEFELARLSEFYPLFRDQLPQVLVHEELSPASVTFTAQTESPRINKVDIWLFALPSDQVVAALSLYFESPDLNKDPTPTVRVLEPCAYCEVSVGGVGLARHIATMARSVGAQGGGQGADDAMTLPPERHQIVSAPESGEHRHAMPTDEVVKRILYRIDPPYRAEFLPTVSQPPALNQPGTRCAVTPYVTLLYGHEQFIENSVFLTTVQAIGTAARFRQIWREAYRDVLVFRATLLSPDVGKQRRADLEDLVDRLGNLQLDLSFSVETSADLGLLIPSLRVESFHRALYQVMELPERAQTVSKMFDRLDASIKSELTAIDIRERQEGEARRLRYAATASAVGFIVAPTGFLLAFFGINAIQVSNDYSVFDVGHYWGAYSAAGIIALLPVAVLTMLVARYKRRIKRQRRRTDAARAAYARRPR